MKLSTGTKITFEASHTGALLFDVMRKAGLLEPRSDGMGGTVWGVELASGAIEATIVESVGLAAAYDRASDWNQTRT